MDRSGFDSQLERFHRKRIETKQNAKEGRTRWRFLKDHHSIVLLLSLSLPEQLLVLLLLGLSMTVVAATNNTERRPRHVSGSSKGSTYPSKLPREQEEREKEGRKAKLNSRSLLLSLRSLSLRSLIVHHLGEHRISLLLLSSKREKSASSSSGKGLERATEGRRRKERNEP